MSLFGGFMILIGGSTTFKVNILNFCLQVNQLA